AYEQDPTAVRRWLRREYPAIAARAKAEGGVIFWGDESGLRSDDVRGRSYAPRGETPVVRPNHRRANVGLVSAVTNRGEVRWMVLDGAIKAPTLIRFLERLVRDAGRKVFLILDRLQVHRARLVRDWLAGREDQIGDYAKPWGAWFPGRRSGTLLTCSAAVSRFTFSSRSRGQPTRPPPHARSGHLGLCCHSGFQLRDQLHPPHQLWHRRRSFAPYPRNLPNRRPPGPPPQLCMLSLPAGRVDGGVLHRCDPRLRSGDTA
ncbi:transposase, partial [Paracraurococcus lichenis]